MCKEVARWHGVKPTNLCGTNVKILDYKIRAKSLITHSVVKEITTKNYKHLLFTFCPIVATHVGPPI